MTALARLYSRADVLAAEQSPPRGELEARFCVGLRNAAQWADLPGTCCILCNTPLDHVATYLVVLMPENCEQGLGTSGAVCRQCGEDQPRTWLQWYCERMAILMFEPAAGRA